MAKNPFMATKSNGLTNVSSRTRRTGIFNPLGRGAFVNLANKVKRYTGIVGATAYPSSRTSIRELSSGQAPEYPLGESRLRTTRDGSQTLAKK